VGAPAPARRYDFHRSTTAIPPQCAQDDVLSGTRRWIDQLLLQDRHVTCRRTRSIADHGAQGLPTTSSHIAVTGRLMRSLIAITMIFTLHWV
jgi:hypothetical protein